MATMAFARLLFYATPCEMGGAFTTKALFNRNVYRVTVKLRDFTGNTHHPNPMASKHIIIVGCGRLGGSLANQLSAAGHSIVVIDRKPASFDKLSVDFSGYKTLGDAVELHILQQARVGDADCLFATTTADNTNLMVAQVAKTIFNVPQVIARVFDPAREALYREFGIETISPVKLSAQAFIQVAQKS
jgi:trk system potassium uptake protein TrkA